MSNSRLKALQPDFDGSNSAQKDDGYLSRTGAGTGL